MAGGSGSDLAIVDMGAGNGCLAMIACLTLDAQVVVVDHTLTREELRVESRIPEEYHHRILGHARHRGHGHGARSATFTAFEGLLWLRNTSVELAKPASRWMDSNSGVLLQGAVIPACCGQDISHTENADRCCRLCAMTYT